MSAGRYKPRQPALEPRWHFVQDVYLPVYEDAPDHPDGESLFAPPSRVLAVSVVGERAFVSVRKYEEDSRTTTTTEIVAEAVSAEALFHALAMQMGVEWVQGIWRDHYAAPPSAPTSAAGGAS